MQWQSKGIMVCRVKSYLALQQNCSTSPPCLDSLCFRLWCVNTLIMVECQRSLPAANQWGGSRNMFIKNIVFRWLFGKPLIGYLKDVGSEQNSCFCSYEWSFLLVHMLRRHVIKHFTLFFKPFHICRFWNWLHRIAKTVLIYSVFSPPIKGTQLQPGVHFKGTVSCHMRTVKHVKLCKS